MNTSSSDQRSAVMPPQSPEVVQAFAELDRARDELRFAQHVRDLNINGLRRFARAAGIGRQAARVLWRQNNEPAFLALIRAEGAHDRALREFRRVALIAALTRVIDTDRRLKASQPAAA
jgi:hypothetical protein